jgi:hypothetical protein
MSDIKWELRKGEEIIACKFSVLGAMARSGALKPHDNV